MILKKYFAYLLAAVSLGCVQAAWGQTLSSLPLSDVIKSQGTGNIDLFKDVSAEQLEQYRLDHGAMLVIGVDINESASGSEKASTQGVAIKRMVLDVRFDDGSQLLLDSSLSPNCCFTESQALLAEVPLQTRSQYYTLLGESGSSRISSTNSIQELFDSTLKIELDQPLFDPAGKTAVSADLQIVLLQTNDSLGDPEAFYDFSGGFEDLALLNAVDAAFIDAYAAGREEAPTVILTNPPAEDDTLSISSWNYFPSASSFYVVGYEDLYPYKGDYDFNDLTVAYRIQYGLNSDGDVVAVQGLAYLVTRGSSFSHDWRLAITLPPGADGVVSCSLTPDYRYPLLQESCPGQDGALQEGLFDLAVFSDTLVIFPDPAGSLFVNSQRLYSAPWNLKFFPGPKAEFRLDFDAPVTAAGLQSPPYDPYLFVRDTNQEVRLMEVDPAYQDIDGYPFGMLLTDNWKPPLEFTDTAVAYPQFDEFVSSEGASSTAWYLDFLIDYIVEIPNSSGWAW
jgi:LruC domain-containing protein